MCLCVLRFFSPIFFFIIVVAFSCFFEQPQHGVTPTPVDMPHSSLALSPFYPITPSLSPLTLSPPSACLSLSLSFSFFGFAQSGRESGTENRDPLTRWPAYCECAYVCVWIYVMRNFGKVHKAFDNRLERRMMPFPETGNRKQDTEPDIPLATLQVCRQRPRNQWVC